MGHDSGAKLDLDQSTRSHAHSTDAVPLAQ